MIPRPILSLLFSAMLLGPQAAGAQSPTESRRFRSDFGPNLQTFAGGLCRQPEGNRPRSSRQRLRLVQLGYRHRRSHLRFQSIRGDRRYHRRADWHLGCDWPPRGTLARRRALRPRPGRQRGPNGRVLRSTPHPRSHTIATVSPFPMLWRRITKASLRFGLTAGRVYRLTPSGSSVAVWSADPLLTSSTPTCRWGPTAWPSMRMSPFST